MHLLSQQLTTYYFPMNSFMKYVLNRIKVSRIRSVLKCSMHCIVNWWKIKTSCHSNNFWYFKWTCWHQKRDFNHWILKTSSKISKSGPSWIIFSYDCIYWKSCYRYQWCYIAFCISCPCYIRIEILWVLKTKWWNSSYLE